MVIVGMATDPTSDAAAQWHCVAAHGGQRLMSERSSVNAVISSKTVAFGDSRAHRSAARRSRPRMTCMRWSAGRVLLGSILRLDSEPRGEASTALGRFSRGATCRESCREHRESLIATVAMAAAATPAEEGATSTQFFSPEAGIGTRLTYMVLGTVVFALSGASFAAPWLAPACETAVPAGLVHLNPDYIYGASFRPDCTIASLTLLDLML